MPLLLNSQRIDTVTFDLDDTLWDNKPVIKRAIEASYKVLNAACDGNSLPHTTLEQARLDIIDKEPAMAFDLTTLRQHTYELALCKHGLNAQQAKQTAEAAAAKFMALRPLVTPFATAIPMLRTLKQQVRVGAISNGNCQLNTLDIGQYFDFWVTPLEAMAAKPDPTIYTFSAIEHQFDPSSTLHIGDCLTNDVSGANQAGFYTGWFNPEKRETEHAADIELHCLSELTALLTTA